MYWNLETLILVMLMCGCCYVSSQICRGNFEFLGKITLVELVKSDTSTEVTESIVLDRIWMA